MPHRRVHDDDKNCTWDVWEVLPDTLVSLVGSAGEPSRRGRPLVVPPELQNGWLAMQCENERRRIVPIPEGWRGLDDDQLLKLIATARQIANARPANPRGRAG